MTKLFFILTLFTFTISFSQSTKKSIAATRISNAPEIDGSLDDEAWINAEEAKNFVMFEPGNGTKEPANRKTIVKVIYDDEAIYFSAQLFDDNPADISMQFGDRDRIGQVDYFQVNLNPFNDGQNDTEFIVMSTGVQGDAKANNGNFRRKDYSWSAVWYSEVSVNENGWAVEIKIPYSALRFSNSDIQTWGVNFQRRMHKQNEQYSWNYIDKTKGDYTQYAGTLTGLKNIKPPTRLSFSPYASSSNTVFEGDSRFENNVGMDLKYGINESFTLDLTLIPDFGQTAFDDQVLNLGPFEQRYSEKRSFFTEGTELFSKGGLFYSRRIGNNPVGYDDVEDNIGENEEIIDNPSKVNMLNAVKVSGRTKGGLGIGVFNAITEKTSARIKNMTTDEIRSKVTEPLTNYSVFVLDQQFNQNSSISLVNTNVLRNGSFRDANTTGLLFDLSDKGNKFNASGNVKMSNVSEDSSNTSGYAAFLRLSKTFGNIQYDLGHYRANDTYDINDLGFQRQNNYANYFGGISYRIFEPTKTFNSIRIRLNGNIRYQNEPYTFSSNEFGLNAFFVTVEKFMIRAEFETNIGDQYDFYEPRVEGRFIRQHGIYVVGGEISTDYRKKFAIDVEAAYASRYDDPSNYFAIEISPRYRFSDKFEVIHKLEIAHLKDEKGWVDELENGAIIFGNRDLKTVTNSITSKLSFNTKSSLALSFRHYWSPVQYDNEYFELNHNGLLDPSTYNEKNDVNYNIWNLDLSYSWEFAPGSQLVALYRNSIFNEDELSHLNFKKNLDNLFDESALHNFSLKFIYYLDYNKLKTWL